MAFQVRFLFFVRLSCSYQLSGRITHLEYGTKIGEFEKELERTKVDFQIGMQAQALGMGNKTLEVGEDTLRAGEAALKVGEENLDIQRLQSQWTVFN